jgi:ribosomal protein S14
MKNFFFYSKYIKRKIIFFSRVNSQIEREWLLKYITNDYRFLKNQKQLTINFLKFVYPLFSRAKLRSYCRRSGVNQNISKHFFWLGRHAFLNKLKIGRISGFRKY